MNELPLLTLVEYRCLEKCSASPVDIADARREKGDDGPPRK
jgi:hypothetical protein